MGIPEKSYPTATPFTTKHTWARLRDRQPTAWHLARPRDVQVDTQVLTFRIALQPPCSGWSIFTVPAFKKRITGTSEALVPLFQSCIRWYFRLDCCESLRSTNLINQSRSLSRYLTAKPPEDKAAVLSLTLILIFRCPKVDGQCSSWYLLCFAVSLPCNFVESCMICYTGLKSSFTLTDRTNIASEWILNVIMSSCCSRCKLEH